jgi:peptidoglycan hydrolase CwlO-like protein
LEAEAGASSRVAELEEMVSALQKEKKDLEASLASVRISAETSIKQLDEARDQATAVEDAAKTAEEGRKKAEDGHQKAEELVKAFR